MHACVHVKSCLTLSDPMDCRPSGSSVHGILQARILEWVAFPPPGDLPDPGIELASLMSPSHYCEWDGFISYSDIFLLAYINRTDFCLLILYPATLLNFLVCSNSFLLLILGFSVYKIISS